MQEVTTMALINRVSRLFQADINAVLDRIEEPELLLRQAIREMEEELGRDERRVRDLGYERDRLEDQRVELGEAMARYEEELDLCFASGKDDLARTLVRRKLESQECLRTVSRQLGKLNESLSELGRRLSEDQQRLEAMRQKAEVLTPDTGPGDFRPVADACIGDEDVEVAFLREQAKRDQTKRDQAKRGEK
jgi:phage shock protein A